MTLLVKANGFTLIEMAVVLVIIGLLIMTVFPALTAVRISSQRAATQSNLQSLMLATAAYVQANGCVPCPTPAATVGGGFGRVGGVTTGAACVACAAAEGIPPFASMGISSNVAHDGWGNWITMRVDPAETTTTVVPPTGTTGICQSALASSKSPSPVNVTTPGGATQQAAVIFVSHGSQGYGAFLASAQPYQYPCYPTSVQRLNFPSVAAACVQNLSCSSPYTGLAYAECNATGLNTFQNPTPQSGYDDMMVFANRNVLVSMFGNGTVCQTGP